MGQKIHPNGFRLGVIRDWDAKWFATGKTYARNLVADQTIRSFLRKRLSNAAVSRIELVRAGETLNVTIHTGRPGIVIGKKGETIRKLHTSYKALESEGTRGLFFFCDDDLKAASFAAGASGKNLLTVLRHVGRLKEFRQNGRVCWHVRA